MPYPNNGGRPKHYLTNYIIVIEDRSSSKFNKKVQCKTCRDVLGNNAHTSYETTIQFGNDILGFWNFVSAKTKELGKVTT